MLPRQDLNLPSSCLSPLRSCDNSHAAQCLDFIHLGGLQMPHPLRLFGHISVALPTLHWAQASLCLVVCFEKFPISEVHTTKDGSRAKFLFSKLNTSSKRKKVEETEEKGRLHFQVVL